MPKHAHDATPRARAFWSGTITFGLVNVPVDLFAAVHGRQTAMRMVDTEGEALGRRYICPKDDKELAADDIVRGYETADGKTIVVTDADLESVAPEMTRDIALRRFVPREQIAPSYFDRPYFLAPSGRSTRAYRLLARTMQRTGRAGIGTFVMRGHQYLVAILSDGDLLRAETLRFAAELRSPHDVGLPKAAKAPAKAVKALQHAIEKLTREALDMDEMVDRYAEEIRSLAESKAKKRTDVIEQATAAEEEDEESAGGNVIDLMQVLRERLAAEGRPKTAATAKKGDHAQPLPRNRRRRPGAAKALDKLSKNALYERAQNLDIAGRSKMSRQALVEAIRSA